MKYSPERFSYDHYIIISAYIGRELFDPEADPSMHVNTSSSLNAIKLHIQHLLRGTT